MDRTEVVRKLKEAETALKTFRTALHDCLQPKRQGEAPGVAEFLNEHAPDDLTNLGFVLGDLIFAADKLGTAIFNVEYPEDGQTTS